MLEVLSASNPTGMHKHINRDDRAVISDGLRRSESHITIADRIGKDRGAIWREVERNSNPDGSYDAWSAQRKAKKRRKSSKLKFRKIENDNTLASQIEKRLEHLVSPEVVAYELGIHHQTIYTWSYRYRTDLKRELTQRGRKRRRYGSKRELKQGWTRDVHSIDQRPEEGESWEGDTVKGSTRSRLLTHVEMESLFTKVDLIADGTADSVHAILKKKPIQSIITYDQGSEFALWKMIEKDTGVSIYFADPHSPWQRGKNENTNGRLRRVYTKKFDFDTITQRDLDKVVWKMNHIPRKSLFWQTSCKVYGKCCNSG